MKQLLHHYVFKRIGRLHESQKKLRISLVCHLFGIFVMIEHLHFFSTTILHVQKMLFTRWQAIEREKLGYHALMMLCILMYLVRHCHQTESKNSISRRPVIGHLRNTMPSLDHFTALSNRRMRKTTVAQLISDYVNAAGMTISDTTNCRRLQNQGHYA